MNQIEPLSEAFWTQRWEKGTTGWDIGYPSPALIEYAQASIPKEASILIPGAGNAYEAIWLFENGWKQVSVLDISAVPIQRLQVKYPEFPKDQLIHTNFFDHLGNYDFVLEQTFFCALSPSLRDQYVQQMHNLIAQGGKLAGLLFNFPLTEKGPPFGGSAGEYQERFSPYFNILKLETAQNSIKPRQGSELFFEFERM